MPLIAKIDPASVSSEISRPDPARLLDGDPVHTVWNQHEREGLSCGTWSSTPGTWKVIYGEWEYFHIRQGHSVLTTGDGTTIQLRAGDAYIIQPGFAGTWQVIETTTKDHVIRA